MIFYVGQRLKYRTINVKYIRINSFRKKSTANLCLRARPFMSAFSNKKIYFALFIYSILEWWIALEVHVPFTFNNNAPMYIYIPVVQPTTRYFYFFNSFIFEQRIYFLRVWCTWTCSTHIMYHNTKAPTS